MIKSKNIQSDDQRMPKIMMVGGPQTIGVPTYAHEFPVCNASYLKVLKKFLKLLKNLCLF